MNRRELLKRLGIGAGAIAVVAAPKITEAVTEPTPTAVLPVEPVIGGVPGALHFLVRERAMGRPMGYAESEDGKQVHWFVTGRDGKVVSGTVDGENPNFAGKDALGYYAIKKGIRHTLHGTDLRRVRQDGDPMPIYQIVGKDE